MKITEVGTISERIAQMVQHFNKGNKSAFAKAVGISNQSLGEMVGERQGAPSFAALQKMLTAFPEVSPEWLVFGRGPMLGAKMLEAIMPAAEGPPTGIGALASLLVFELSWAAENKPARRSHWHRLVQLPVELSAGRHLCEPALARYAPGGRPSAAEMRLTVLDSSYHLGRHVLEVLLGEKVIAGPAANYDQVVHQLRAVGWQQSPGGVSEN